MSLTSMLANKDSELNALLDKYQIRERAVAFVNQHNAKLSTITPVVSLAWGQSDYAMTGTAAIYMIALAKGAKHLISHVNPNIANFATTLPIPYGALLCALTEQQYRKGFGLKLSADNRLILPSGTLIVDKTNEVTYTKMQATVMELQALESSTAHFLSLKPDAIEWEFHKTFGEWSTVFGGADANLMLDDTIVDIRTTRKRQPMTVDNFLQQVMYTFLASADEGKTIGKMGWYYVRHGIYVEHNPDYLLGLSAPLHQMIEDAHERAEEERDEWDEFDAMDGMTMEDYFDFD